MGLIANTVQRYSFETAFLVPASSVIGVGAAAVQEVVARELHIPDEHVLALGHRASQGRYEGHMGDVTFVDWEAADGPQAQVAPLQVDIYGPNFLAKAWARAWGREANASVNVTALGPKPLGGGDSTGAPDNAPLPISPARELVTVG